MAKTTRKPKAKRATKSRKAPAMMQASESHAEDHIDGCDVQIDDSDATSDAELPPARGGVRVACAKRRGSRRQRT